MFRVTRRACRAFVSATPLRRMRPTRSLTRHTFSCVPVFPPTDNCRRAFGTGSRAHKGACGAPSAIAGVESLYGHAPWNGCRRGVARSQTPVPLPPYRTRSRHLPEESGGTARRAMVNAPSSRRVVSKEGALHAVQFPTSSTLPSALSVRRATSLRPATSLRRARQTCASRS